MVKGQGGFQPARQHPVHQPVVEVEPRSVHRPAPLGQHPRPRGGKAVNVEIAVPDQIKVFGPAVIVVAGNRPVFGAHDVARRGGEGIPMGRARAAEGVTFDLIGGGGGTEPEALGKIGAVGQHGRPFRRGRGRWIGR